MSEKYHTAMFLMLKPCYSVKNVRFDVINLRFKCAECYEGIILDK